MTQASTDERRRSFVFNVASGAMGLLVAGCAGTSGATAPARDAHDAKEEEEVSPVEDLMREHGLLNRLLLVYEEGARRIEVGEHGFENMVAEVAKLEQSFGIHDLALFTPR